VESSRVELARQPFDLRTIVRRAIEAFEKAGELGKVRIVAELPDAPATARVDAEKATHAIVNVLTNALRSARGEVTVKVSADGARVHVDVEDDGPGIAAAAVPGLFDRDARIRANAGKSSSGLGLNVVKAIVDAHGGAVTAENRASPESPTAKGARVRLSFPTS
jgi:signal transduction histidine kinase